MNYILRYVFYAIGIVVLAFMASANPEHVHFVDLVQLVQSPDSWRAVALIALLLAAFDAALSASALVSVIPNPMVRKVRRTEADATSRPNDGPAQ